MITHTLYGAQPPGRVDGVAWDRVRVEEAAPESQSGPYTAVSTQAIAIDTTPETPDPIDITFTSNLVSGWYRLVFLDPANNESPPTEPVFDDGTDTPTSVSRPTPTEVAHILTSRTRNRGGALSYDWNDTTIPSRQHVEQRITYAYNFVVGRFGDITNDLMAKKATHLIAIYTAMLIELSFYAEQINADRSPYVELRRLFDTGMSELEEELEEGGVPVEGVSANTPNYGFPETSIGDGIMP